MAGMKTILSQGDIVKAKETQQILKGTVLMAQRGKAAGEEDSITVECQGHKVLIVESEVMEEPFRNSLAPLVGTEIEFIILDAPEDVPLIIGSNKKAIEIAYLNPIMEKLKNGEVLTGVITNILQYGAYLTIGKMPVFMKNEDFSNDMTTIKDIMNIGDTINVRYARTSQTGTIHVEAIEKHQSESVMTFDDFEKDQLVLGTVKAVKPFGCFVCIASGIDALASIPSNINLSEGQKVQFKIKKVKPEKKAIRGIITKIID